MGGLLNPEANLTFSPRFPLRNRNVIGRVRCFVQVLLLLRRRLDPASLCSVPAGRLPLLSHLNHVSVPVGSFWRPLSVLSHRAHFLLQASGKHVVTRVGGFLHL